MPVYNDWDSLEELLKEISELSDFQFLDKVKCVVVNDASSQKSNLTPLKRANFEIEIIALRLNLGHQRAIAVGLAHIFNEHLSEKIIVLDSDGEDNPAKIRDLIRNHKVNPDAIVVATRVKRLEKLWFRTFYWLFKFVFRALTGVRLNFGNFTLLTRGQLEKLVSMPDLWNNYPATILKSKLKIVRVPIARDKRRFGTSKLNFVNFIQHGFGAISVFSELALIRMLLLSFITGVALITASIFTLFVRFFSDLALPGWTSLVLISLVSNIVIISFIVLLSVIQYTGRRNKSYDFPLDFYKKYIKSIEKY